MRKILIIFSFFLISSQTGITQNIKKLLTSDELNRLKTVQLIEKNIDSITNNNYQGFTGRLEIEKQKSRIIARETGKWERKSYRSENDATMIFDSLGFLLSYQEFNKNNILVYNCIFRYDSINQTLYQIRVMENFDDSGLLYEKGNNYWKVKMRKSGKVIYKRKGKFGEWEYYDNVGKLKERKYYGEIARKN